MDTGTLPTALAIALDRHHQGLTAAIQGLGSWAEQREYAQILLNRLLLLHALQSQGWLNGGDAWYLQTLLGHSQDQGRDRFYAHWLQPLCLKGLGLPELERPLAFASQFGKVPYLGGSLCQAHPLESPDSALTIADEPFEGLLAWLAETPWQGTATAETATDGMTLEILAAAFDLVVTAPLGKGSVSSPATLAEICDRTLHAHVLAEIQRHQDRPFPTISALLANLDDTTCRCLVETVLPQTTLLDPACGSGRFLLALLAVMTDLYQACLTHALASSDRALQGWGRSLIAAQPSRDWAIKNRIITQNLYGVDLSPEAVAITQLQLFLALLATVEPGDAVAPPLPVLDFNILRGNALVGFIRVDEESFDQVPQRRQRAVPESEPVLQGNLLQPLAAESYRTTLAEKQIRIEHYRAQTQAMGEAAGIPPYVQAEFLRDRIEELNQAAQAKLNQLLLNEFSQKLGIRVREPQILGRSRKRLLKLADIEALHPFHWGFHFHAILEIQGGFAAIVTHPPEGTLRPRVETFYHAHGDYFQAQAIPLIQFRKSRKLLLQQHPTLAAAWTTYAGQFSYWGDYCRRSGYYPLEAKSRGGRSPQLAALFAQRCQALSRPGGIPPWIHPPEQKAPAAPSPKKNAPR